MKIRLTQPGYESFTGLFGSLTFTNGLSDDEVSIETAAGIANLIQCDRVEDDIDVGQFDVTDPSIVVRDTTGDPDVANEPAPANTDNTDVEPVDQPPGTPEADPV
jgi:hypothetical protein